MLTASILFFGFLLLRLPFRSSYPVNWDSVQFVMGIQNFDVVHHRPHPPGYIGYIAGAKLLNVVVGDPHSALILISILSGALVPAAFYLLARRFMAQLPALSVAIIFGSSMLVSYYSEVALTYIVELALIVPILYFLHRAIIEHADNDLLIATVLLAAVGSIRQTALVLMLPLWFYALWRTSWRQRIQSAALLGLGVLVWLVPLLWLSGGPQAYMQASRDLAEITGGNTSILAMKPLGVGQNIAFVVAGLLIGVNLSAIVIVRGRHRLRKYWHSSSAQQRMFFLLWALPALVVYIFGHTGQIGYILMLLPIPFLALGLTIERAGAQLRRRIPSLSQPVAVFSLTGLLAVSNILGMIALPAATHNALNDSVRMDLKQFYLAESDRHWNDLEATIRHYPPNGSVVLTTIGGPRVSGSFRHLSYLTPEYPVYGLGRDLDSGAFGPLFIAHEGGSDYEIPGMRDAETRLELPPDTRYIIIPDAEIASRIENALGERPAWIDRRANTTVVVIEPSTVLAFSIRGEVISMAECLDSDCDPDQPPSTPSSR